MVTGCPAQTSPKSTTAPMPRKPWGYWSKKIGLKDGTLEYRQWYWKNVEKPRLIKERIKVGTSISISRSENGRKNGRAWGKGFVLEAEMRRMGKAKRIMEYIRGKRGLNRTNGM